MLVLLLVVPLDVPPLVALGTLPGSPGTLPVAVGTWPGSAGTDGTVTPPVVPGAVVPTECLAAPLLEGMGGVMTTVPLVVAPVVPVVPVLPEMEPEVAPVAGAARTAGVPSGRRHVTSRFEQ